MDFQETLIKKRSKWRILLVIVVLGMMLYTLASMVSPRTFTVSNGRVDLSNVDFSKDTLVALNGQWEFYWNKLLSPEDFIPDAMPEPDSFMKVPGVWSADQATHYDRQGVATYRLMLTYPSSLQDPALRVQNVANACKLYVNGQLTTEVGNMTGNKADYENDDDVLIIELPKDSQSIELVFQVANLNFSTGGLRAAPVFGSMQVLEQQRLLILVLQMVFIGGVFIFGVHYFFLFLLQTKNKTALFFAIFCLVSALRSLGWGERPLTIFFLRSPLGLNMYLNYFTGYNFVALVILFVHSLYPSDYKKGITALVLLPSLVFDALLLIKGPAFATFLTNYLYLFLLLQMLYLIVMQTITLLRRRDNAVLMFIAVCVLIWAMNADILNFLVIGSVYFTCMFLFGNFAFILAMSYIQAKQQATTHKKLILYNEKLLEADKLKDQIMATEMSFLQAQIKPHFLYNALSAIANVCEKDRQKAGKLIIDLAVYLRGSLEFNNLDKMVTIEKELEFVDTYFHIEQARFGQKIQLQKEIDIPLDVQIPVLILQPLVENAVRHGISKKLEGGVVIVRMTQKKEAVCIEIEDDGVGISDEKLATLLGGNDVTQGVGLLNIHNRLLKSYGCGLIITREAGHTCVKLLIPEVV
ncbi:hypothetical protein SDC9_71820 [bioreactor metagenome]|uniref:Histidine kinase/HSP90-like ATPase domain-containing protein n=1 Tax=bioreactor metagenome TaxID=1076179 RepID=A0A644YAI6_9ZZZZ